MNFLKSHSIKTQISTFVKNSLPFALILVYNSSAFTRYPAPLSNIKDKSSSFSNNSVTFLILILHCLRTRFRHVIIIYFLIKTHYFLPVLPVAVPASGSTVDYSHDVSSCVYAYTPDLRGDSFAPPTSEISPGYLEQWAGLVAMVDAI